MEKKGREEKWPPGHDMQAGKARTDYFWKTLDCAAAVNRNKESKADDNED